MNFGVTRIGVHAGPALVGNFGGSRFFDYTAYGDTINTAARLEAANKFLGTRICVSATVAEATENFRGRPVGDLMLRGRSEPLRAFEPLTAAAFEAPMTTQYSEAFAKLEAGDTAAMPAFAALVGLHADDWRWPASICDGCSTAPRASACNWNKSILGGTMTSDLPAGNYRFIPAYFNIPAAPPPTPAIRSSACAASTRCRRWPRLSR